MYIRLPPRKIGRFRRRPRPPSLHRHPISTSPQPAIASASTGHREQYPGGTQGVTLETAAAWIYVNRTPGRDQDHPDPDRHPRSWDSVMSARLPLKREPLPNCTSAGAADGVRESCGDKPHYRDGMSLRRRGTILAMLAVRRQLRRTAMPLTGPLPPKFGDMGSQD